MYVVGEYNRSIISGKQGIYFNWSIVREYRERKMILEFLINWVLLLITAKNSTI